MLNVQLSVFAACSAVFLMCFQDTVTHKFPHEESDAVTLA